jgi:DNA-binding response OmpR family regulator
MRILIVEDQRRVGRLVARALQEQGYLADVAETCRAAQEALVESDYDAVVLDIGLPDGDGLELLREWRARRQSVPILILSARDALEDRVLGLNLGADDYLPKPFSIEELLARLRSLLRRQAEVRSTVLVHGPVRVDLLSRVVTCEGEKVELTSREFALLELFLQNPNRLLTRTFIAERVWDAHYGLETNLIDVYVRRLRRKLERRPEAPLIRTVRGTGYQLV